MMMRVKSHDGIVHLEQEPWWPWCDYPKHASIDVRSADFIYCKLTEEAPTCLWCVAGKKRP